MILHNYFFFLYKLYLVDPASFIFFISEFCYSKFLFLHYFFQFSLFSVLILCFYLLFVLHFHCRYFHNYKTSSSNPYPTQNIIFGCVARQCQFLTIQLLNHDVTNRWPTTKMKMNKPNCWAKKACVPVNRDRI